MPIHDWVAIKIAYETTLDPVEDIGRAHNMNPVTIFRAARKGAWVDPRHTEMRTGPMPKGLDDQDWLNPRQRQFVREYMVDLNATKAAMRSGYSPRTANEIGAENLAKPHIRAAINVAMAERSIRTEITADRVLQELAKIGFANMADYVTPNGHVDIASLDRYQAAAVAEVTVDTCIEGSGDDAKTIKRVKLKLHDKRSALISIGRHIGMFVERREVGLPGDFDRLTDDELDRYIVDQARAVGIGEGAARKAPAPVPAGVRGKPH